MRWGAYIDKAKETDVSPKTLEYYLIGMIGEIGEFYDEMKKVLRDDKGKVTEERLTKLIDEWGDFKWYESRVFDTIFKKKGITLGEILNLNIIKLQERKKKGKLHGR